MRNANPTDESPTKKQRSRERIVKSAARALRKQGYHALSVGKVMRARGSRMAAFTRTLEHAR